MKSTRSSSVLVIMLAVSLTAASARGQLPATSTAPLNQLGRAWGWGLSDGYHECPECPQPRESWWRHGTIPWSPVLPADRVAATGRRLGQCLENLNPWRSQLYPPAVPAVCTEQPGGQVDFQTTTASRQGSATEEQDPVGLHPDSRPTTSSPGLPPATGPVQISSEASAGEAEIDTFPPAEVSRPTSLTDPNIPLPEVPSISSPSPPGLPSSPKPTPSTDTSLDLLSLGLLPSGPRPVAPANTPIPGNGGTRSLLSMPASSITGQAARTAKTDTPASSSGAPKPLNRYR
jgi:hypothetical protein